jgi:membrane fusion protein, multidrug efflux system
MEKIHGLAILALILAFSSCDKPKEAESIQLFKALEVGQQTIPIYKDFVGQIYGKADIPIRTRVDGFLEGIHFKEGFEVKKGQLLYTVDDSPLRENQAREESRLSEAKINFVNAENDLARLTPLAEINAISKRDLDAALARRDAAKEAIKAAEANVNIATINKGYSKLYAPMTGIIGKSNAKVGEYVGRSPNPVILNTISQIDSIVVEFFLTEKDYITFAKKRMAETSKVNDQDEPGLDLYLADDALFPYKGKVTFVDRNIDASTGAILIQSVFPNPEKLLRPGQFAKVRAIVNVIEDALLVPQRAVFELQGFYNVYVVDQEGTVTQKRIEILETFQDHFVVKSGLAKGEIVLTEGLMTVKSGQKINIDKTTQTKIEQ